MVLASANELVSEHAADILRQYDDDKEVSLEDFIRAFSPLDLKTKSMITVFEELSDGEDAITSEILISSLGKDSRLLFQENEMLDLVAFLQLSDLFDDQGELVGIPKAMLEQLHKVNSKLLELNLDVDLTDRREKEMENQLKSLNNMHQKEKSMMFEAAACVEKERDDLYAELSSLRKKLNSRPAPDASAVHEVVDVETAPTAHSNPTETDVDFTGFDECTPSDVAPVVSPSVSTVTTPTRTDLDGDSDDLTETSTFLQTESEEDKIEEVLPLSAEIAASIEITPDAEESEKEDVVYTGVDVDGANCADNTSDAEESEKEDVVYTGVDVDGANCTNDTSDARKEPVDVWSAAVYNNMPWYFETASRTDAETLLSGEPAGAFIVRKSSRHEGWVVSIAGYSGAFLHYLIQSVEGGYALQFLNNGNAETVPPVCKTLVDLVEHFQMTTINENTPILKRE